MKKMSREVLKEILNNIEEPNIDLRKDLYFEFKNPYNLVFIVYFDKSDGSASYKEYTDATKAFRFWLGRSWKHGAPFISVSPKGKDSFPGNFRHSGDKWEIALKYLEFLEKTENWVKFLKEEYPEDLK